VDLPLGLLGTNGKYDKASSGSNRHELELLPSGGKFYAFDRVASNMNTWGPEPLKRSWRAHDYWAKLDAAQVDAAIELLWTYVHAMAYRRPLLPIHDLRLPHCFEVAGILCHANCRQDKTDMILEDWVGQNCRRRVSIGRERCARHRGSSNSGGCTSCIASVQSPRVLRHRPRSF